MAVGGCYSGVHPDGGGGASNGDASGGQDESGSGESGSDTGEPGACGDPSVGNTPLRRITRMQYANAVKDVLGVTPDVTSLEGDEKVGPFDSNVAAPVSGTNLAQYRSLAEDVAEAAVGDMATLVGCDASDPSCLEEFVRRIGRRLYRRPVQDDEVARLVALADLGTAPSDGVRLIVQAMLQSPLFLYQLEIDPPAEGADVVALSGHELATRLSFFLWGSVPDDELLDAADAGALDDPDTLREQAERLLADSRARAAVASFHVQWLAVDDLERAQKDATVYPLWTEGMRDAMVDETKRFSANVVLDGDGSLETLLTASFSYLDGPLFELYGIAEPADHDPSQPVDLDPQERAGLLTQGAFLAEHAHPNQSGPVQRGVVVRTNLLCDPPPPPPPDVDPTPPDPDPDATTRERFHEHTQDPACAGCHVLIDGIGLGFEGYDGIGVYRETENDLPVDQSGSIIGTDAEGDFVGVPELAAKLAASDDVRACVATQWFRFAFGRYEVEEDDCSLDVMRQSFADSGYDVRELLLGIVTSDAFRYRAVAP